MQVSVNKCSGPWHDNFIVEIWSYEFMTIMHDATYKLMQQTEMIFVRLSCREKNHETAFNSTKNMRAVTKIMRCANLQILYFI
jgi:hypothetical protein